VMEGPLDHCSKLRFLSESDGRNGGVTGDLSREMM
jgi:hypothetical protein